MKIAQKVMAGVVALWALGLMACGPSQLKTYESLHFDEEAKVKDTTQNVEVLEVVDAYKNAMEKRDAVALKGLISEEYYENSGTTETTKDDYGSAGIPDAVGRMSEAVKSLRLDMIVKDMNVDGDRAWVVYEYIWNFRYEVGEKPRWDAGRDVNRMELVKDDGGLWKISRGL